MNISFSTSYFIISKEGHLKLLKPQTIFVSSKHIFCTLSYRHPENIPNLSIFLSLSLYFDSIFAFVGVLHISNAFLIGQSSGHLHTPVSATILMSSGAFDLYSVLSR